MNCHWQGCERTIRKDLFMCRTHWRKLPRYLKEEFEIIKWLPETHPDYIIITQKIYAWIEEL